MQDLSNVFQNVAFPVAVCCILFYVLFIVIKNEIKQNNDTFKNVQDVYDKHLDYLQMQNGKLTSIIAECTKALNDNTRTFNDLITVISGFERFIQEQRNLIKEK